MSGIRRDSRTGPKVARLYLDAPGAANPDGCVAGAGTGGVPPLDSLRREFGEHAGDQPVRGPADRAPAEPAAGQAPRGRGKRLRRHDRCGGGGGSTWSRGPADTAARASPCDSPPESTSAGSATGCVRPISVRRTAFSTDRTASPGPPPRPSCSPRASPIHGSSRSRAAQVDESWQRRLQTTGILRCFHITSASDAGLCVARAVRSSELALRSAHLHK